MITTSNDKNYLLGFVSSSLVISILLGLVAFLGNEMIRAANERVTILRTDFELVRARQMNVLERVTRIESSIEYNKLNIEQILTKIDRLDEKMDNLLRIRK